MSVTITPPRKRECELCGREERWDDDLDGWQIAGETGNVYCIHEWDINGSFTPLEKSNLS
ncbi:HEWD family protein [Halorubrum pallidum]|uniref:HEWD family protein n=1 Tax=Halorubrum pallidum TaxID=1526114 RepID=A0ABD5SZ63_9EURY